MFVWNNSQAYRDSLRKSDPSGPQSQLKVELENKFRHLTSTLYTQKSKARNTQQSLEEKNGQIERLNNEINVISSSIDGYHQNFEVLESDLSKQNVQMERAKNNLSKLKAKLAKTGGSTMAIPSERDESKIDVASEEKGSTEGTGEYDSENIIPPHTQEIKEKGLKGKGEITKETPAMDRVEMQLRAVRLFVFSPLLFCIRCVARRRR